MISIIFSNSIGVDIVLKIIILIGILWVGLAVSIIVNASKPLLFFVIIFTIVHTISIAIMFFLVDVTFDQFGDITQFISVFLIGCMFIYMLIDMKRTNYRKWFRRDK
jgi:hypothetical protein